MFRCSILAAALAFSALPAVAQTPDSAAARSAALNTLFHDVWEDSLKRSPVFASSIGDLRYNDQLPDLSPRAINDRIAAEHGFLVRLLSIDPTGLSDQQRRSADFMQRELVQDIEAAPAKEWELPLSQSHGIHTDLTGMVTYLRFTTVKDYDDYIARLNLVPRELRQASDNLLSGIGESRMQPTSIIEKALAQTDELANQAPADSPFSRPLREFPASIDLSQQKRISAAVLDAIQTDVLPAYARFTKFLRVTELPASQGSTVAQPAPDLPGRALGYSLGQIKILALRDRAQSALGSKFDLKAFHDIVVQNSAVPTDILEQQVNAWIAATK
jgi:uncharacterized protein (DUF885 family)